jgi:hypothetical protein
MELGSQIQPPAGGANQGGFPPGHVDGLEVSFTSVTQVGIAPGTCKDSTGTVDIIVPGALTATISTSGANGLDTGSEAASTWYALYVIAGTSGVASLLSASFSSPTLPGGYTHFRRVGAVLNDSGLDIENFFLTTCCGRLRRYHWENFDAVTGTPVLDDGTTSGTVSFTSVAPPSASQLDIWFEYTSDTGGDSISLYRTGSSFVAHLMTWRPSGTGLWRFTQWASCNTSQQVDYSVSAGNNLDLWMMGWEEIL